MKIFVRTQDRSRIIEIDCISYEEKRTKTRTAYSNTVTEEAIETRHRLVCCGKTLGEYASKERCLDVMSDIQNAIATHNSNLNLVFNMPEI